MIRIPAVCHGRRARGPSGPLRLPKPAPGPRRAGPLLRPGRAAARRRTSGAPGPSPWHLKAPPVTAAAPAAAARATVTAGFRTYPELVGFNECRARRHAAAG